MLRPIFLQIAMRNPCFAVRTYRRDGNRKPRDMAGIRIQAGIMNNVDSLEEDPEVTYDADFSQLGQSYNDYQREMAMRKEQLKMHITRDKHFKMEKQPNFLTWAEKEQIRYLNKQDPDRWTPERLTESFPAIEEVVIKILKAKWAPANMNRIRKHDAGVKKNWELFKANQLTNLDPEVQKHLSRFSDRNFDNIQNAYVQTNNDQIEFQFPKPKNKEFFSIVSSCKRIGADSNQAKLQDSQKNVAKNSQIDRTASNEQILLADEQSKDSLIKLNKKLRNKEMTYEELIKSSGRASKAENHEEQHLSIFLPKEEISLPENESYVQKEYVSLLKDDSSVAFSDTETNLINPPQNDVLNDTETTSVDTTNDINTVNLTLADISSSRIVQKYQAKSVSLSKLATAQQPLRHKINIPPQLRKRGSVYRLYDCFYDDRGRFMYRVPGLTD